MNTLLQPVKFAGVTGNKVSSLLSKGMPLFTMLMLLLMAGITIPVGAATADENNAELITGLKRYAPTPKVPYVTITSFGVNTPYAIRAESVTYTITFSQQVTGLTASNFNLWFNQMPGAGITSVQPGSGNSWIITISTGNGGQGMFDLTLQNITNISPAISPDQYLPYYTSGIDGVYIDRRPLNIHGITYQSSNTDQTKAEVGDVVTFSFIVDDNSVNQEGSIFPFPGVPEHVKFGYNDTFYVNHTMTEDDTPGAVRFTGQLIDGNGNISNIDQTSTVIFSLPVVVPVVVTSLAPAATVTNASTVNYTLTLPQKITGVTAGNFSLTQTGVSGASIGTPTASSNNWIIPVNTGTGDGEITLNFDNATGINKEISTTLPYAGTAVIVDKTVPIISSIGYATTNADPAKAEVGNTVTMNFSASESITGTFTVAGVAGTLTNTGDNTYSVSRTMQASDAAGIISFVGNVTDAAGNITNVNQTSAITILVPPVTISNLSAGAYATAATVNYNISLSSPVTGFTAGNFELVTTGNVTGAYVQGFDEMMGVIVNTGTGDGTIQLKLVNSIGLSKTVTPFTGSTVIVDKTKPSLSNISFTTTNSNPAYVLPGDVITMYFTGNEVFRPEYGYFTIAGAPSNAMVNISGNDYKVSRTIVAGDTDGPVRFWNNFSDVAFNQYLFDQTSAIVKANSIPGPTVTSFSVNTPYAIRAESVSYTITFSQPVTGLTASNFNLWFNQMPGAGITSVQPGTGNSWIITISTGNGGQGMFDLTLQNITNISPAISSDLYLPHYTGGMDWVYIDRRPLNIHGITYQSSNTDQTVAHVGDVVTFSFIVDDNSVNQEGSIFPFPGVSEHVKFGYNDTFYVNHTMTTDDTPGAVRFTGELVDGNGNITNIDQTSTVIFSLPSVAVNSLTPAATLTNASTVNYTLAFPEVITGVTAGNFDLTATGTITSASIGTPMAEGNDWIIPVTTGSGDGDITLKLVNATGLNKAVSNTLPFEGTAVTIDKMPPTATISAPSVASTRSGQVKYILTYSGESSVNFDISHFINNQVKTGNVNAGSISLGLNPHSVTFGDFSGNGTFAFRLPAGAAADAAGNQSLATELSPVLIVDNAGPVISNIQYTTTNTNPTKAAIGDVVTMTFTSSEPVTNNPSVVVAGVSNSPIVSLGDNDYSVTYTVLAGHPEGLITFQSYFDDVLGNSTTLNETSTISIDSRSANTTLSLVILPQGTLTKYKQGPADVNYMTSVSPSVLSVQIQPTAADTKTVIRVNDNIVNSGEPSGIILIESDATYINILATAENGVTQTYSVQVNRTTAHSAKVTFKVSTKTALTNDPAGTANINYQTIVGAGNEYISVTPEPENPNSVVRVNGAIVAAGSSSDAIALNAENPTIINIKVTSEDGSNIKNYNIKVIKALSSNTAATFTVSTKTSVIKAASGPATVNYATTVDPETESITVTPAQADLNSIVYINGVETPYKTASGDIMLENISTGIPIVVQAPDGSEKTYSITVTKSGSNDAFAVFTLSSGSLLTKTTGTRDFNYETTVPTETETITITPAQKDPNATVFINGTLVARKTASDPISLLSDGVNTVNIEVHAQDGVTVKTYSIVIHRTGSNNNNATFTLNLASTLVRITGDADINYAAGVDMAASTVRVTPRTEDSNAKVYINGILTASKTASAPIALSDGTVVINITVEAQNGVTKTYSIAISKNGSNNANTAFTLSPNSQLINTTGTANVNYSTSVSSLLTAITVKPKTADANAKVTVNGLEIPRDESATVALVGTNTTIHAIVTAQNGTVKTYDIVVKKSGSNNANATFKLNPRSTLTTAVGPAGENYTTTVLADQTSVTVIPRLRGTNARITINGVTAVDLAESNPILLPTDNTLIQMVVTAEDNVTVNTYSILVTKAPMDGFGGGSDHIAGGNMDDATGIHASKTPIEQKGISIYPNPFVDRVRIDLKGYSAQQAGVDVRDLQGRRVFSKNLNVNQGQLEVSLADLHSGIYIINVTVDNERKAYKIIKN